MYKFKLKEIEVGDTDTKGGKKSTVTDVNPETGAITWDIKDVADFTSTYKELEKAKDFLSKLEKTGKSKDDPAIDKLADEIQELFNTFRTHIRKNYPEEYKRVLRLKESVNEEEKIKLIVWTDGKPEKQTIDLDAGQLQMAVSSGHDNDFNWNINHIERQLNDGDREGETKIDRYVGGGWDTVYWELKESVNESVNYRDMAVKSANAWDGGEFLKYIKDLNKKNVKIPQKYMKDLLDTIKYANKHKDEKGSDYHQTEAINDFYDTLEILFKNGILTGKELNESVNEGEFKKGDTLNLVGIDWKVDKVNYKPGKSYKNAFTFKGPNMDQVNIPNPPKTNKTRVGYLLKDKKYGDTAFFYQYGDISKLVMLDESVNESFSQEDWDIKWKLPKDNLFNVTKTIDATNNRYKALQSLLKSKPEELRVFDADENHPAYDMSYDELMKWYNELTESFNKDKKWSSYEQRMVNQIKAAQKEGRGMYTLPMKTQDFYRKHKDKFDESVNEGFKSSFVIRHGIDYAVARILDKPTTQNVIDSLVKDLRKKQKEVLGKDPGGGFSKDLDTIYSGSFPKEEAEKLLKSLNESVNEQSEQWTQGDVNNINKSLRLALKTFNNLVRNLKRLEGELGKHSNKPQGNLLQGMAPDSFDYMGVQNKLHKLYNAFSNAFSIDESINEDALQGPETKDVYKVGDTIIYRDGNVAKSGTIEHRSQDRSINSLKYYIKSDSDGKGYFVKHDDVVGINLEEESSTSQGGASFTPGSGAQYATPYAFKKKNKSNKSNSIYKYKLSSPFNKPVPKKIKGSGLEVKQLFEKEELTEYSDFQQKRINVFDEVEERLNSLGPLLSNAKNATAEYYNENPGAYTIIYSTDMINELLDDIKELLKQTE